MAMTLYILVEGDTEERFADRVLVPHLADREIYAQASKVIVRGRRGGADTATVVFRTLRLPAGVVGPERFAVTECNLARCEV